jgi:hypothetical protein
MKYRIVFILASLIGQALGAQSPQQSAPVSAEWRVVENLVNTMASPGKPTPALSRQLELLHRNPAPYIPLLGAKLQPTVVANGDTNTVREAEIAAGLLVRDCGDAGRSVAAQHFDRLHTQAREIGVRLSHPAAKDPKARAADVELAQREDRLILVARAIVAEFAQARDPRLRDLLVARFATDDYSTQLRSLQYFEAATRDDPKVHALLRQQYETKQSGFYQSPRVRALIGAARDGGKSP